MYCVAVSVCQPRLDATASPGGEGGEGGRGGRGGASYLELHNTQSSRLAREEQYTETESIA